MRHKFQFSFLKKAPKDSVGDFVKEKHNAAAGFTLLETVVAVMILSYAIVGPFALAAQSLRVSRDARDELTATQLAVEAIEVAHSVRDNNSADDSTLTQANWMQNILSNCANSCIVDITQHVPVGSINVWNANVLFPCPVGGCGVLATVYFNPMAQFYRQSRVVPVAPWLATGFVRTLTVSAISANQVKLTATVTYRGYGKALRTVTITDDLYNWFPPLH